MPIINFFKGKRKKQEQLLALIQSMTRQEILMEVDRKGELRPDGSKIGGQPWLPPDFSWPTFHDAETETTRPLSFFCQIDLAQVTAWDAEGLLPKKGLLSFFYDCEAFRWGFDPADKGAARVLYFENGEDFAARPLPDELAEEYRIPELAVRFAGRPSYPDKEELELLTGREYHWDDYDKALQKLGIDTDHDPQDHKLLGYADVIQSEMLIECERISRGLGCGDAENYGQTGIDEESEILAAAKDWTLLLQLYTIETEDFEWMFGDCGMLYFYIRKQDLAQRKFEDAWFCVQCG